MITLMMWSLRKATHAFLIHYLESKSMYFYNEVQRKRIDFEYGAAASIVGTITTYVSFK